MGEIRRVPQHIFVTTPPLITNLMSYNFSLILASIQKGSTARFSGLKKSQPHKNKELKNKKWKSGVDEWDPQINYEKSTYEWGPGRKSNRTWSKMKRDKGGTWIRVTLSKNRVNRPLPSATTTITVFQNAPLSFFFLFYMFSFINNLFISELNIVFFFNI